jgi:hypothetical protein
MILSLPLCGRMNGKRHNGMVENKQKFFEFVPLFLKALAFITGLTIYINTLALKTLSTKAYGGTPL